MPETLETLDEFMTPATVELLQLAATGCLRTISSLRDDVIRVEFRLERPHDPQVPWSALRHAPSSFAFDGGYPVTRMAAAVLGRRGLIDVMWHGKQMPLWEETATGRATVTREGRRALSAHLPSFDPDGPDDWRLNETAFVKGDWLVPGNIVHASRIRFQVHEVIPRDTLIQIKASSERIRPEDQQPTLVSGLIQLKTGNDRTEYFDQNDQIRVEVASLLPGQRNLANPVTLQT